MSDLLHHAWILREAWKVLIWCLTLGTPTDIMAPPQWDGEHQSDLGGQPGSRASAILTGKGLQGAHVFQNVPSWSLWVCGKEKEAKIHM